MRENLKDLTLEELKNKRSELYTEDRNLRFSSVISQVDNPLRIRVVRRQIARVSTILREMELEIRQKR